jgi:peptidoglycan/xylan/chitin deacetylase (PgdA/CDA1 family)
MDPGMQPQTTFDPNPSYIPKNVIVITLDDVPGTNDRTPAGFPDVTAADLALFKTNNLKVDFFINTNNYDPTNQNADIMQMMSDGHYLANHTIHHYHLGHAPMPDGIMACNADPTCDDTEIGGNETAINTILNNAKPHFTRFRAPFGEPYQGGYPAAAADQAAVGPVVAKYAVAYNWNFDSGDSNGMAWNGTTLYQNVVAQIGTAGTGSSWGIMLAHGVYSFTYDMLKTLIPYLKQNGFVLANLEDVSCWMWGKHTWDIIPNRTQN